VSDRLFTPRFISLWLFQCATFFSVFQLLPVIPLRIIDLGGGKGTAGLFLFVYTLASAFGAPVMGTVADHVGRRRVLVAASMLFVVFSLLYGVVPWLPVVLFIGIIHGTLWSALLSSSGAIMSELIPPTRRTEGLAYWGLAPTAAMSVAPAVGLFVHRFGWLTLCAEIAVLSALTALWASRLRGGDTRNQGASFPRASSSSRAQSRDQRKGCVDRTDSRDTSGDPSTALGVNWSDVWDWPVVRASLSLAVIAFGYGGITSYVALLSRERSIRPESLFFTVFAIASVLIRVFTSRLGDRFGYKVLLYPAFLAMPLSFALLARAQNRVEMAGAALLLGFGMGTSWPAFMTFVLAHSAEERRARTFGSVILAFDMGIGIGSVVVGAIGERYSLGRAFDVAALLACLAIPIFLATSRRLTRGTAVAENAEHAGNTS
jgi:MFS family permease